MPDEASEKTPDLSISREKLLYIIAKAREFDAKDVVTDPDDASNPTDDAMISVLEDHRDDPIVQEIAAAIFSMSEDEQIDLVTLAWIGRGDGSIEDWDELRAEAARAHNKRTASYLLGMPLLADYLDEALSQFGHRATNDLWGMPRHHEKARLSADAGDCGSCVASGSTRAADVSRFGSRHGVDADGDVFALKRKKWMSMFQRTFAAYA